MMRKLPLAEIVVSVAVVAAGAGVYWYAHRDQGALEESKQSGAVIVAALERHRADTGTYPPDLDALVPAYLPQVAAPTWGLARWRYRRYTPAEITAEAAAPAAGYVPPAGPGAPDDEVYFQLSVAANESGYPVLYYDYTARRWVLNN
jgi:hypothetical protein